jgi:penicillin-binding protein activator
MEPKSMMKKFVKMILVACMPVLMVACASGKVSTTNPMASKKEIDTFGLTTIDFEFAAKSALDEFMMSPWLAKKEGRWLVQIGNVRNETVQEVDTKRLTQRMVSYMTKSGKFAFSSVGGSLADKSVKEYRQLEKSDLYDQDTGGKGKVVKPDLSMIGEISQTTNISADRSKQQLEYEFRLRVTDLSSGIILFDSLVPIDKRGSNKNFAW